MPVEPLMHGSPPEAASIVNVDNWQDPPFNRWAFSHMREIIPTQPIPRGTSWWELPVADRPVDVGDVTVDRLRAGRGSVSQVLNDTYTDAVVIVHRGKIVFEHYPGVTTAATPHLLMSVSKSLVGTIAGILVADGLLDPDRPADDYVPEIAGFGYSGARVRDILDMRTGAKFSEEYTNPDAEVRRMEPHMGWRSGRIEPTDGMYSYLTTLNRESDHGGKFEYRSSDADMLGWICERAADKRMADLISSLLWAPMGAEHGAYVTCDCVGTAIHDGGVSATARDMARFGQLLLDGGRRDGVPIVPRDWLAATRTVDRDIRDAFAPSEHEPFLPGGWYRNQFWMVPGPSGTVQLALGIHGQMVCVDHETSTAAVKFSTWPNAQNPEYLVDTIRAFCAVGRRLDGLSGAD